MKKVLVINTKYTNFGGEDANIKEEVNLLKQLRSCLEFQNIKSYIFDIISFFTGKTIDQTNN